MKAKADRFTRIVRLAWMVVAILLLTELIRGVVALGPFNSVTPGFSGSCKAIALTGPGDMAVDARDQLLFIAASNRRGAAAADGLYALNLADPKAVPQKLANTPRDFHPYALALGGGPGGGLTLAAVNWRGNGHTAIDIFNVTAAGAPRLSLQTTIEGGLLVQPSAIAAMPGGRFYAANVVGGHSAIMRWIEKYGLLPRANVVFFNTVTLMKAIDGLSMPEGVAVSADGSRLYVTSANERRLLAYSIAPFNGNLEEIGSLAIPARLGHLTADGAHALLVAGQPKAALLTGYDKNPASPAPSVVYRVTLDGSGVPQSYEQVFGDDGRNLGSASSVALAGKRLFIGSGLDSKLLDCAMP